jgi:hypothetical protein
MKGNKVYAHAKIKGKQELSLSAEKETTLEKIYKEEVGISNQNDFTTAFYVFFFALETVKVSPLEFHATRLKHLICNSSIFQHLNVGIISEDNNRVV